MLTREDDLEIHALHKRGWSISAIARHTGRNRRTVRNDLNGVTTPGDRKPATLDPFEPFLDYVTHRLREDPHLLSVAMKKSPLVASSRSPRVAR